jgi:hypothetical protein
LLLALIFFGSCVLVKSQTPIQLLSQPNNTYTENFSDINNWVFNAAPTNGTFTAGIGAGAWKGIDVTTSTPTIPNATRITTLSNFFQTPPSGAQGYSGGVYKGSQSMVLLSIGTTDNSTSVGMDFFLDFTGLNAGTLSFDWSTLNNSTGNRNGSLRVYASTDGTTFTEITTAQVLNFTNNITTAGSITNISLPSFFNGSSTARLRFYYYNGTGGTSGSRPRLNLDNIKITALPTATCTTPTTQPTAFTLGTVINNSIQFSFTAANPAPQNYLVVMSNNSSLSSNPINNTTYNIGDNLGDGTVIAVTNGTTVTATGLTNSATYHFFIFSMNNVCTGGPLYVNNNPLHGSATTLAGALPCVAPSTQPTSLVFSNITTSSVVGNFTAASNTDEYLIVRTTSPTFTGTLNNGTNYNGGNILGNGSVVTRTAGTTFTSLNLTSGIQYYFFVFGLNSQNCNGGPIYNSTTPLTASVTTVSLPTCATPTTQPTALSLNASSTSINGYFIPSASADGYLIVRSTSTSLSTVPNNGTNYTVGNTLGNGTVLSNSSNTSFIDYGLNSSTQYYYFVFSRNSICGNGGPFYLTLNPLTANTTTTAIPSTNYYFGNLHAHSYYSDGNKDNSTFTPADDYAYAKNSLCMDFLGISEHNHATAGMSISNWQPGLNQAVAATASNFLALYGMEYGVISNGGHVLVYGSNQLIGWETNNYNIYVPKSDYIGTIETTGTTGLFRTINNLNNSGSSAFASFAHPDFADYNNLANIAFNSTADSALIGCAVASGPAFSTSTTYSDPPSAMAYLGYYNKMLSKGYHIGPLMDHDTHYTNFGRSSNNRLGVIATSLNSSNFYAAIKSRNFYATEDCDTKVNFTLNNQLMGSITSGTTAPAISVYAIDPTNPSFTPTIKIMYGIPGSNVLPVQITSTSAFNFSFTDNTFTTGTTGYYYADITIAGNRTITAPIWYTRNTAVPLQLLSFTASVNSIKQVSLNWITSNEINSKVFITEKSLDGITFISFDSVAAFNNSSTNHYSINDKILLEKTTYYRLKQIDLNGKYTYSNTIAVNLSNLNINSVSLYPNPVKNTMNLGITSTANCKVAFMITDVAGRIVLHSNADLLKGSQNNMLDVSKLSPGNYQITVLWNNQRVTQKLIKL